MDLKSDCIFGKTMQNGAAPHAHFFVFFSFFSIFFSFNFSKNRKTQKDPPFSKKDKKMYKNKIKNRGMWCRPNLHCLSKNAIRFQIHSQVKKLGAHYIVFHMNFGVNTEISDGADPPQKEGGGYILYSKWAH